MSFGRTDTLLEALAAPVHAFVNIREIEASDFDVEVLQRSRTSPVVVCFACADLAELGPTSVPPESTRPTSSLTHPRQASGDQRAC